MRMPFSIPSASTATNVRISAAAPLCCSARVARCSQVDQSGDRQDDYCAQNGLWQMVEERHQKQHGHGYQRRSDQGGEAVFAPAEKLTTERLNPPVTGYAPVTPAAKLAAPSAMSSWFDSTVCRRFDASVFATNAFEKPTKLTVSASGIRTETRNRRVRERRASVIRAGFRR